MSKMNIKVIKLELLDWLSEKLKQVRPSDLDSSVYLDSCIRILQSELPKGGQHDEIVGYDPIICKRLESLGFDETESKILSALLNIHEPVSVGNLSIGLGIHRAKTYRILEKYYEMGILEKTPLGISRFVIKDKLTPFSPLIKSLETEIRKFQGFRVE